MFVVVVVVGGGGVVEVVVLICLSSIDLTAGFTFIISSNIAQYFWKLPVELVGHFCVRANPFLPFSAENSTVTLYGRGFIKFNVAVWCGFKYNGTYRLGKYTLT